MVQLVAAIWIWLPPMNDIETKRLAHAINELRPSWPISSLTTFIARNLARRPFRDAAMALVWVALDIDAAGNYVTDTPKRVLESGPWWKAAEMNGTANSRATAPRRDEQCRDCGRTLDGCLCETGPTPYTARPNLGDHESGVKACRDALNEAVNR
jgi:hypothetical protein